MRRRHWQEREGTIWARIMVPKHLRQIIGKTELVKSLGSDQRAAERSFPSVITRMQQIIAAAEKQAKANGAAPAPKRGIAMTEQRMAITHYEGELRLDEALRNTGQSQQGFVEYFSKGYETVLRKVAAGAAQDDEVAATIGWAVDAFVAAGNAKVSHGTPEWRSLARTLALTQLEAQKRIGERDSGNFDGKPSLPLLVKKASPETPQSDLQGRILEAESELSIAELVQLFISKRPLGVGTQHEQVVSARMFTEFMGEDVPVYKITRRDVQRYADTLLETPSNYTKRFPNKTLPEAIKANKALKTPYEPLSATTVGDKWLSALKSCLNWAVSKGYLPDNPASGVIVENRNLTGQAPRVHFGPSDLAKIFGSDLFRSKPWTEDAWAYVLSLYLGTRPSELAQVALDSIQTERGVLLIRIEGETKNTGSQRVIPVHKDILALGFQQRVAELRKAGETHLFPRWFKDGQDAHKRAAAKAAETGQPPSLGQHYPRFIPKRFNVTFRKKIGLTDERKDFYSFRHSFKTGLAQAGVPRDLSDLLTGHADGKPSGGYIHGHSTEALHEAINRLQFDGLEGLFTKLEHSK